MPVCFDFLMIQEGSTYYVAKQVFGTPGFKSGDSITLDKHQLMLMRMFLLLV